MAKSKRTLPSVTKAEIKRVRKAKNSAELTEFVELIKKYDAVMKQYPASTKYVKRRIRNKIRCNRCGAIVLKSELRHTENKYKYQCMFCDEDLYGIETHKGAPCSTEEAMELIERTAFLLCFDEENKGDVEK